MFIVEVSNVYGCCYKKCFCSLPSPVCVYVDDPITKCWLWNNFSIGVKFVFSQDYQISKSHNRDIMPNLADGEYSQIIATCWLNPQLVMWGVLDTKKQDHNSRDEWPSYMCREIEWKEKMMVGRWVKNYKSATAQPCCLNQSELLTRQRTRWASPHVWGTDVGIIGGKEALWGRFTHVFTLYFAKWGTAESLRERQ